MIGELRKIYPNENIKFEGKGWHSEAYTVGDNIIRIPLHDNICSYEKEEKMLDFLKDKITFEIPQVKVIRKPIPHSIHKKLLGKRWFGYDYEKLTEKEKNLFAADGALFFAQLHSVKFLELDSDFLEKFKPEIRSYENFEENLKNDFSFLEIEKLYNFYLNHYNDNGDKVLVYDDFHENNTLMDDDYRLKSVYDFGNITIENRAKEFSAVFDNSFRSGLFTKILKEYEKLLNISIDLQDIKHSRLFGGLSILLWLNENKKMREEKKVERDEHIETIRKFLNSYNC